MKNVYHFREIHKKIFSLMLLFYQTAAIDWYWVFTSLQSVYRFAYTQYFIQFYIDVFLNENDE